MLCGPGLLLAGVIRLPPAPAAAAAIPGLFPLRGALRRFLSGGKSNYDRSSDGNIMFHKFSLVTGVGIGVLLAPVSCWCPRGRLAPLCYASLAGDGLLVATHRHRPPATPHTNRKYKDFTKHSFVFCSFHHCGFWAAISSSFVQIHMCLKKVAKYT